MTEHSKTSMSEPTAEPHAFSIVCSKCGARHVNDQVDIKHPIDYLSHMRGLGWLIPYHNPNILCKACVSS